MLAVAGLSFSFKDKPILRDVNFTLEDGQIVGLVAPNGTGKTTLLKLLCGLLPAPAATITLNGLSLRTQRSAFLKQLFFLESSAHLYADLTVRDHLLYVKRMWRSRVDVQATIKQLQMESYYTKRIKNLSLGMKQHALLAMYMISDAQTMLIDEPLNGLDPTSIQQFEHIFGGLRAAGKTLLVSSHQMDSVGRVCDQVFFMKDQALREVANTGQDMMALYTQIFMTEAAANV
ncbi:ATP-binding cassette domain-containing protein [Lacticaseibacillus jixianensis]|uniref:ATP-binding cassette domain-containing protein n=1 Tax=Lacticaseibacillus jixianensis TaxID=2486012 RepID=A0ABW4B8P3_9LACO|nr:ATP-binding cassette domain-containing protein [Lacticaseibacillus jixianensis]